MTFWLGVTTCWEKDMMASGQSRGWSEGPEGRRPSVLPVPSVPTLPEASQLLPVCPARHPGPRPVPNPPARPLGTLFLLTGQLPPREPGWGQSQLRGGPHWEWAVGLGLSFPTPKGLGKGTAGAKGLS